MDAGILNLLLCKKFLQFNLTISRKFKGSQQKNILPLSFVNIIRKVPVKRHDQNYY